MLLNNYQNTLFVWLFHLLLFLSFFFFIVYAHVSDTSFASSGIFIFLIKKKKYLKKTFDIFCEFILLYFF